MALLFEVLHMLIPLSYVSSPNSQPAFPPHHADVQGSHLSGMGPTGADRIYSRAKWLQNS